MQHSEHSGARGTLSHPPARGPGTVGGSPLHRHSESWRRAPTLADLTALAGAVGAAGDVVAVLAPDDAPALTAAGEAMALLHAAPVVAPARARACLRLAVDRLVTVERAARVAMGGAA